MARNTNKRPHELTLDLFAQNATQTPSEIDAFVQNGPYSSKHIWFLRKLGYDISVSKQGRTVLSYTYNGTGTATATVAKRQIADPVAAKQNKLRPAAAKVRVTKAMQKVVAEKVAKTDNQIKAANLAKMKSVTAKIAKKKLKARKAIDKVADTFGSSGEIATSFSIDGDWDSVEGVDLMKII